MPKSLSTTSPVVADTLRTGLLQVSPNTGATWTADNITFAVGHVFGRYGQGHKTLPTWQTTNKMFN